VLAAADPVVALQSLAHAWRRELGARVLGVTGSTGRPRSRTSRPRSSGSRPRQPENFNTEIGLPATCSRPSPERVARMLEMADARARPDRPSSARSRPRRRDHSQRRPGHLRAARQPQAVAAAKAEAPTGSRRLRGGPGRGRRARAHLTARSADPLRRGRRRPRRRGRGRRRPHRGRHRDARRASRVLVSIREAYNLDNALAAIAAGSRSAAAPRNGHRHRG